MPQWAGSCWYYLRFLDPKNDAAHRSRSEAYDAWMPVDLYVGGAEHAVLHLLYARFWHKVLFDVGVVKHPEPFAKLVHQGMILGENNEKMAKSRGNVVNPDDVVKSHGADALRLYEMFMGPLEAVKPWQTSGIEGVRRFLDRAWNVVHERRPTTPSTTRRSASSTRRSRRSARTSRRMRFNTAISAMMILVNHLRRAARASPREAAKALALLVSPFAPHLGEELWQRLGARRSRSPTSRGRRSTPRSSKDDVVEIGVQVNGKVRGRVQLAVDADEETAQRRRARRSEDRSVRRRARRSRRSSTCRARSSTSSWDEAGALGRADVCP